MWEGGYGSLTYGCTYMGVHMDTKATIDSSLYLYLIFYFETKSLSLNKHSSVYYDGLPVSVEGPPWQDNSLYLGYRCRIWIMMPNLYIVAGNLYSSLCIMKKIGKWFSPFSAPGTEYFESHEVYHVLPQTFHDSFMCFLSIRFNF